MLTIFEATSLAQYCSAQQKLETRFFRETGFLRVSRISTFQNLRSIEVLPSFTLSNDFEEIVKL
jgi:hypothetical protein